DVAHLSMEVAHFSQDHQDFFEVADDVTQSCHGAPGRRRVVRNCHPGDEYQTVQAGATKFTIRIYCQTESRIVPCEPDFHRLSCTGLKPLVRPESGSWHVTALRIGRLPSSAWPAGFPALKTSRPTGSCSARVGTQSRNCPPVGWMRISTITRRRG